MKLPFQNWFTNTFLNHNLFSRKERRIFLFLDIKSSTATAERLGHAKYSVFLETFFSHIYEVLPLSGAEIYQFVGDEAVLTWKFSNGLNKQNCIRSFFLIKELIAVSQSEIIREFGQPLIFKGAIHGGNVTAINNIHQPKSYHGAVLNITARLQELCNPYHEELIVSGEIWRRIARSSIYSASDLG